MNLKKFFLIAIVGIAFTACDDKGSSEQGVEGVATYVNLSISLPGLKQSRSLPDDYNSDGVYEGLDFIETLDIYMRSGDGIIEAKRFTGSDISTDGSIVSPSQPIRTTSGNKMIYVVLNNPGPLGVTITSENDLVNIAGLARTKVVDGIEYDLIAMTGKTSSFVYIDPDVPAQDVVTGPTNNFTVQVSRAASRVIVTMSDGASKNLVDDDGKIIGSVSNITYSVAQGTKKVYWIGQSDYNTYGTSYVPVLGTYVGQADTYYDYSGLSEVELIPLKPVNGDGYKSLKGKFLFENTHQKGDVKTTDYRKGNTAYVLVRAIFTPTPDAIVDGGPLTNGTFYLGISNGKIYSSKHAAQTSPFGVQNQKVATYVGGKMLNYAWLNPDDIAKPLNSPVIRNHIYHVNITGFKRLAYNWNPLFPEDPDSESPQNPDPKPGPEEPISPIDPIDPLTPEQTYMTVDITVLDWTVHSYDIEF